ncbi:MAG TPA: hypothetical protein ENJ12_13525 [Thiolapillus brandeum]|uniref:Uncharacterized protein n=1 Tax=Thiolapillus brandeum TaxID=1076588 RepID=A0A831RVM4_9GAMM|nr:hypothetical protein [Thiolapillus brandeum]
MKTKYGLVLGVLTGVGLSGMVCGSDMFDKNSSDPLVSYERDVGRYDAMKQPSEALPEESPTAVVADALSPYPNTTGTRRSLRLAGSVFKPRRGGVGYEAISGAGGCIRATSDAYTVFTAPVILPQGAAVEYVRMYVKDSNATIDTQGWFTVYDLNGEVEKEYSMTSSGSGGHGYWTTDKIDPVQYIDYNNYSYVLNWRPYADDGSIVLCGFRLYYYMPSLVR